MSAGMLEYDWMVSVKQKPWHEIGTVVDKAINSDEAIKIAKLDWNVVQQPVFMANKQPIDGYFVNVRDDVNIPLGIVKGRYQVEQNKDAFKFVDDIISNTQDVEAQYETAGSLFNGKRVFITVKLPNTKILDDDVEHFMYFINTHDRSSSFLAGITSVRIVCNNTLQMALNNSQRSWSCRHTSSLEGRQQEAARELGLAVNYLDNMKVEAEQMVATQFNEKKFLENFYAELTRLGYTEKRFKELTERSFELRSTKDDLQNFKNTNWGMFNAIADVLSNQKPTRDTQTLKERRLIKSFVGQPILQAAERVLMAA